MLGGAFRNISLMELLLFRVRYFLLNSFMNVVIEGVSEWG